MLPRKMSTWAASLMPCCSMSLMALDSTRKRNKPSWISRQKYKPRQKKRLPLLLLSRFRSLRRKGYNYAYGCSNHFSGYIIGSAYKNGYIQWNGIDTAWWYAPTWTQGACDL